MTSVINGSVWGKPHVYIPKSIFFSLAKVVPSKTMIYVEILFIKLVVLFKIVCLDNFLTFRPLLWMLRKNLILNTWYGTKFLWLAFHGKNIPHNRQSSNRNAQSYMFYPRTCWIPIAPIPTLILTQKDFFFISSLTFFLNMRLNSLF